MSNTSDTIVALATALGEASIHILRISGPEAKKIINDCFEPKNLSRWNNDDNFTIHLGYFHDAEKILDEVLVSRMNAPKSYTGEDVYEINCHGGLWVAQAIMEVCLKNGARIAEPGEFTKRAFINGKLDLIQAEAIVDLISARTETGGRLALSQLRGGLSDKIFNLRESILEVLAFIEAGIDFPEDDVESLDREGLELRVSASINKAIELLEGSRTGKIIREGLLTVIAGRPNVGKSSLLNALVHEERAIVTDIPGTTRDEIREIVKIGGILLNLVDTAGIHESEDLVEKLGIDRTKRALKEAELVLLVIESTSPLSQEDQEILQSYGDKVIVLVNKIDLLKKSFDDQELKKPFDGQEYPGVWIPFSVVKEWGFKELEEEIKKRVYRGQAIPSNEPLLSNVRQISSLERCLAALKNTREAIEINLPWDILSIDIRQALEEVSLMTGDNVQESLLDDIFARFCIGK